MNTLIDESSTPPVNYRISFHEFVYHTSWDSEVRYYGEPINNPDQIHFASNAGYFNSRHEGLLLLVII